MYKYLLDGQSCGQALHMAKMAWLNTTQTAGALYLPYYWDSLILISANNPVHLEAATNKVYWYAAIGALLGVILAFIYLKKQGKNNS